MSEQVNFSISCTCVRHKLVEMAMHVPAAGFASMLKEGAKVGYVFLPVVFSNSKFIALPRTRGGSI